MSSSSRYEVWGWPWRGLTSSSAMLERSPSTPRPPVLPNIGSGGSGRSPRLKRALSAMLAIGP